MTYDGYLCNAALVLKSHSLQRSCSNWIEVDKKITSCRGVESCDARPKLLMTPGRPNQSHISMRNQGVFYCRNCYTSQHEAYALCLTLLAS